LDPAGDAYILLPKSKIDLLKEKYKKINPIKSRLLDVIGNQYKDLAFHLISEIYYKNVSTLEDIHTWFKRSFAFYQNHELDDELIDTTVDLLKKCGAVWEEDDTYTATNIGKIASLFYFSPFDVSDLKKNFTLLFSESKQNDDLWVSLCLGNTDTQRMNIISKSEKAEISMYVNRIRNSVGGRLFSNDSSLKAGYCYNAILNGIHSACMGAIQRNFQMDYDRMHQVLKALDSMTGKWNQSAFFETLQKRIRHGVKPELIDLCSIPGVGKVRADKLYKKGIKTPQDFAKRSIGELKILLNLKEDTVKEMMQFCTTSQ
jgi:helicase